MSFKRIAIFCGSMTGNEPVFANQARALVAQLAKHNIGVVYGGGRIGLMGVVADAALDAGLEVVGVIPHALMQKELGHGGCTQLHVVDTMHQRKALMSELADGFIALPGGFGTADEMFEILTWAQLGMHQKPCALLNVQGYFDGLLRWLDEAVARDFLRPLHRELLLCHDDPIHLLAVMQRAAAHIPHAPATSAPDIR